MAILQVNKKDKTVTSTEPINLLNTMNIVKRIAEDDFDKYQIQNLHLQQAEKTVDYNQLSWYKNITNETIINIEV